MEERSEKSLFFLSFWLAFLLFISTTSAEKCTTSGPCTCNFTQWQMNLSPLVSTMKNSEPIFTVPFGSTLFNYNPCKPFLTNATGCEEDKDLAVNRISKDGSCTVIGDQKNAVFKGDTSDDAGIYLEYTTATGSPTAKVFLQCSNVQSFKYEKEEPIDTHVFRLETIYACQPVNHTLSAGSVLLILFMVAITIYLIGGFLFKHFYLQAQGVEIIPHYSFWSDFPLLVRDGCYFTFRGCQGPTTYERI